MIPYRSPTSIRSSYVARAIEVTKVFMSWSLVTTGELMRKAFRAHAIDATRKVAIGNGRIPGLNGPHGLTRKQSDRHDEDRISCFYSTHLKAPTVAEGLKTISAPFKP